MAEQPSDKDTPTANSLDLSALENLSLGPNWSSSDRKNENKRYQDYEGRPQRSRGGAQGGRRDRRPPRRERPPRAGGSDSPRSERPRSQDRERPRGGGRGNRRPRQERPFVPTVDISLYPEDTPFRALTQAVRNSCRTYELFEIARLILEKTDRFVCVVKPLANAVNPMLYISVPDGVPFETEEEAVNNVFEKHVDAFFEVEEVEVDPPKGNFQMVHKCGYTGELLGAPNYHRYQQILQAHHAANLPRVPYDRFVERLESVRDEEAIQAWVQSMTKQNRYKLKDAPEGSPQDFDSLESARFFLLTHQKEKIVTMAPSARFSGKMIEDMPTNGNIRRSLDSYVEGQKRFPLDTANHLRGRLRRLNFAVYKKGSKGVSYICAVKRRFREPEQMFTESLQNLIDFIEEHENFKASDLPKEYLGITVEETPEAEAALGDEEKTSLAQLRNDLRWLVHEGYVIEYSDGRLFAPPRKEAPKPKKVKEPAPEAEKTEDAPKAEAVEETPKADEPAAVEATPVVEETPAEPVAEENVTVPVEEAKVEESAEVVAEATPVAEEVKTEEPEAKSEEEPAKEETETPEEPKTEV